MGEFWREHADKSIASGASLVALSIRGDILRADRGSKLVAKLDYLDVIKLLAKLIMMGGSGGNGSGFAWDKADVTAVALEKILVFKSESPSGFLGGPSGIIADAEGDFAIRKLAKVF